MRRAGFLAAIMAAFVISVGAIYADDGHNHGAAAATNVTNKACPVMGADSPVDPKVRVEYKGQFVYFCCGGCLKKFEKDPEATIAKMSAEEQAAIKVNDVCPTTGEKIENRDVKIEHNGKMVYFCCNGCKMPYAKKNGIAVD